MDDARLRGFLFIDVVGTPVAEAGLEGDYEGRPPSSSDRMSRSANWRRELAWLRARTDDVLVRISGDNYYYWGGKGDPPDQSGVRPWDDGLWGHIDGAISEVARLRAKHAKRLAHPRDGVSDAPKASSVSGSVPVVVEVSPPPPSHPGFAAGPVILACAEPHLLAGWWGSATGFRWRYDPQGTTALGWDSGDPELVFAKGEKSGGTAINLIAHDVQTTAAELVNLGGVQVDGASASSAITVRDPEGNLAHLQQG